MFRRYGVGLENELEELKQANRRLVEAIKELRLIRRNMLRYSESDNEYMRAFYDMIRVHVGEFLRAVIRLRDEQDIGLIRDALKSLRAEAKKDEALGRDLLDNLIRDGLITVDMASSCMNDMALGLSIHKHLIRAARSITALAREPLLRDETELVEEDSLNAEKRREIDALLRRNRDDIDQRVGRYGRPG